MRQKLRRLIPVLLLADVAIFYTTGGLGGATAMLLGAAALLLLVSGMVWQRRMKG